MLTRRLATILVAVLLSIVAVAPASAAVDDYSWSSSWGGYVDKQCGSTGWKIEVYASENYTGSRVRICGPESNLCFVPMDQQHGQDCWGQGMSNDRLTSFKVLQVPSGYHVELRWNSGYDGPAFWASGNRANIGSTWNDAVSSIHLKVNT